MSSPKLSIVIPTYNRRASLEATLDGLDRQTASPALFEVVVVSDGSPDDTDAFVKERAAQSPYVLRLLRQANAGPSRARNRGIEHARGEVVLFLDDDVEPLPGCVDAHLRGHADEANAVIIGAMTSDPARRQQEPAWVAWEHAMFRKHFDSLPQDARSEVTEHHFYTGNSSVRREHLQALGGFNETFRRQEDVELASRLAQRFGARFLFEPGASGVHRPGRSLASWMDIPYSYGRLDVQRARQGNVPWSRVQHGYFSRNALTRLLADLTLGSPGMLRTTLGALVSTSRALYGAGVSKPAMVALSAACNLRYLDGVQEELGVRGDIRRRLSADGLPQAEARAV